MSLLQGGRRYFAFLRPLVMLPIVVLAASGPGCSGKTEGLLGAGSGQTTGAGAKPKPKPEFGPWFVDRAAAFGLDVVPRSGDPRKRCVLDSIGPGVALFDFDRDGDLDLFVAGGSEIRGGEVRAAGGPWLFRNDGPGQWTDTTASSGVRHTGWAQGVAVADYDADGFADLIVVQHGPDTLWRNRGDGTFEDVTRGAGIEDPNWGVSATWGDVDGDGWVDLYVTNYLEVDPFNPPPLNDYLPEVPVFQGPATLSGQTDRLWRNRGDGTFEDGTEQAGLLRAPNKGMSALLVDLDEDGHLDLYVTNDTHANELFQGLGEGRFEEIGVPAGVACNMYGIAEGSMAVDVADLDGNGRLDLAVSNFRQEGSRVYANLGDHSYEDLSSNYSLWGLTGGFVGWGLVLADFDADGWPDLFQANGHVYPNVPDAHYDQPVAFLHNREGRLMEEVTAAWGPDLDSIRSGRAVAVGDLDNDGDLDLVISTIDGPLRVLMNEGTPEGSSVTIQLVGQWPNLEAIGALVEVEAAGRTFKGAVRRGGSILAASDVRLHFGLGDAESIEAIRVRWPDGSESSFEDLDVDTSLILSQDGSTVASRPYPRSTDGPVSRSRSEGEL